MRSDSKIPVLDVRAIFNDDPAEHLRLAKEFYSVYSEVGFSYIVNHQIPAEMVEGVFSASRKFHALPRDRKMQSELNQLHRGFIPINTSTDVNSKLAEVTRPNQSESFMVMREDSVDSAQVQAGDYLAGPNQWPDLEGFRSDVMAYNDAMSILARKLVDIIGLALGADQQFTKNFDVPTTWLRLLYYPANSTKSVRELEANGMYGSAPHTVRLPYFACPG